MERASNEVSHPEEPEPESRMCSFLQTQFSLWGVNIGLVKQSSSSSI